MVIYLIAVLTIIFQLHKFIPSSILFQRKTAYIVPVLTAENLWILSLRGALGKGPRGYFIDRDGQVLLDLVAG